MKIDPKQLAIGAMQALARDVTMPGEPVRRFIKERRPREQPWEENHRKML